MSSRREERRARRLAVGMPWESEGATRLETRRGWHTRISELVGGMLPHSWASSGLALGGGAAPGEEASAAAAALAAPAAAATAADAVFNALTNGLLCSICYDIFYDAVSLDACGHSFCAPCASCHFAELQRNGQPPECPFRCPDQPKRIVPNWIVRGLVEAHGRTLVSQMVMDSLVPLHNQNLPFDFAFSGPSLQNLLATLRELGRRAIDDAQLVIMEADRSLIGTITGLVRSDEAAGRVFEGMMGYVMMLMFKLPDDEEMQALCLANLVALTTPNAEEGEAQVRQRILQTMWKTPAPEAANFAVFAGELVHCAMRRYPESVTIQMNGLVLLNALISPGRPENLVQSITSYRGLELVLGALDIHPSNSVIAAHGLRILGEKLNPLDGIEAAVATGVLDALRWKGEGEGIAGIMGKIIICLPPAYRWRAQHSEVLAGACSTMLALMLPGEFGKSIYAKKLGENLNVQPALRRALAAATDAAAGNRGLDLGPVTTVLQCMASVPSRTRDPPPSSDINWTSPSLGATAAVTALLCGSRGWPVLIIFATTTLAADLARNGSFSWPEPH